MKIVVVCCDAYRDIVPAWYYLFKKNWADCPYEPVFVTTNERLDVDAPSYYINDKDHKDAHFGWRMRQFIKQYYSDELLLFYMADYLIKDSNQTQVAAAEALCRHKDIVHVRLRPMPPPQRPFEENRGFGIIDKGDKRTRYVLSLQPGIWKTEQFYRLLRDDEDPWRTEIEGSARALKTRGLFLSARGHVVSHINYYMKGRVTPHTIQWVRDNVSAEYWPRAVREE